MPIAFGQSPRVLPLQTKLILAFPPPSRSLGSRSPRIPRSFSPPSNLRVQLHQLSSQPSNTLGHGARHACEAFGCDYFRLGYHSPLGDRVFEEYRRNSAATAPRFALPNHAQGELSTTDSSAVF
ncbi:hypothetical protein DFH06DRAFT_1323508 [Mycena polygramma]|nr:hypothetical protein DFH06DRAFT_1323508 [Mycena polygramma]